MSVNVWLININQIISKRSHNTIVITIHCDNYRQNFSNQDPLFPHGVFNWHTQQNNKKAGEVCWNEWGLRACIRKVKVLNIKSKPDSPLLESIWGSRKTIILFEMIEMKKKHASEHSWKLTVCPRLLLEQFNAEYKIRYGKCNFHREILMILKSSKEIIILYE